MARRHLSNAEKDARRRADRERLEHAARELLSSDGWKRWIRVRATNGLARYSLRNQWLIALECHRRGITPTYVAGFRAFLDLNRCVRKGEAAIRILARPRQAARRARGGDRRAEDLLPNRRRVGRQHDRPLAQQAARAADAAHPADHRRQPPPPD